MTHSKNDLRLAKVALVESRMASELSALVRRHRGLPTCVPAVREQPRDASAEVSTFIDALAARSIEFVVLQTGVSIDELVRTAARIGREAELIEDLRSSITVCRGPKPVAALKRLGVTPGLMVPSPHTTVDLLGTLLMCPLDGAGVAVIHHGEKNFMLTEFLRARCGAIQELVLYEWELPEDLTPLEHMVRSLVRGEFDAIAFTSQVQVRNLMSVADGIGLATALVGAMQRDVVVAAVGPTCASELRSIGIDPAVVPTHPKMGHMVIALADYLAANSPRSTAAAVAP